MSTHNSQELMDELSHLTDYAVQFGNHVTRISNYVNRISCLLEAQRSEHLAVLEENLLMRMSADGTSWQDRDTERRDNGV